jgi:peptidoglycan/xylan/chitin deacetylase (PgdA/CDA1 family)
MYHRIIDASDNDTRFTQPGLVVFPGIFTAQMAFLKREFEIIALPKLVESLETDQPIPPNAVVITFDDGWEDNYTNAFPILRELDIPATIFLTIDYIETGRKMWFLCAGYILASNKIAPNDIIRIYNSITEENIASYPGNDNFLEMLKKYDSKTIEEVIIKLSEAAGLGESEFFSLGKMLNWDQIMKMEGIDFGSHGLSHSIMTLLNSEQIRRELCESKRIIEEKLGTEAISFAYPNGNFNSEIKAMVREARYKCALATSNTEKPDLLALGRIGVHNDISIGPLGGFSKALFMYRISGLDARLKSILQSRKVRSE